MDTIEQLDNIKLHVTSEGGEPSKEVLSCVRLALKKLMHLYGNIVGADMYLKQTEQGQGTLKWARWRVGIPGRDIVAEASATNWQGAIAKASQEVSAQLLNRYHDSS